MPRLLGLVSLVWLGIMAAASELAAEPGSAPAWCASELETLEPGVCFYDAEPAMLEERPTSSKRVRASPDTLVLFLHPLVKVSSNWQWEQQRTMLTAARAHGFSLLVPRGRPGLGPGRLAEVLAWPTSAKAQEAVEDELIGEWRRARAELERRRGRPFAQVWVFGFSNGAYYATSLALRDRFDAQGYGVFAGGAGSKYNQILGAKTARRAPIFVGYGSRDPARKDMRELVGMLRRLGWSHRAREQPVGHVVTYEQLRLAVRFLGSE
jgi:predicted esterase